MASTYNPRRSEIHTTMHTEIDTPGLWRRMACWLYEGMLLFAVGFLSAWLFSTLGQVRNGMDPRRLLLVAFLFVIFGIYFTWFWSKGQTLAMKTWDVRVVGRDGKSISQLRAFGRYCLSCLWLILPLAAKDLFGLTLAEVTLVTIVWLTAWIVLSRFRADKQLWHDVLSGTRLIISH